MGFQQVNADRAASSAAQPGLRSQPRNHLFRTTQHPNLFTYSSLEIDTSCYNIAGDFGRERIRLGTSQPTHKQSNSHIPDILQNNSSGINILQR